MRTFGLVRGAALALLTVLPGSFGYAQTPAEFYQGKSVELLIGYSVGGGYDVYARLLARHIGKHIPGNPAVVVKNMEGTGSLRLANWLYNVAPRDGTVFGTIGRGVTFDPLLGAKGTQFDATKFTWLGSGNDEVSICVSWQGSGVNTVDDLLTKVLTVGGTGGGSDTDQFPKILNGILGTKMQLISGYPGGNDVSLAMQRGEVKGRCGWSWSSVKATHADWVAQKKMNILLQLSLAKHPDLPNVPLVLDLAKTEEQKQVLKLIFARQVMGRPFLAPPGIPKDRADALKKAFTETMHDPEFLLEAQRMDLEVSPVDAAAIEKLVAEVYQTPPDIAAKAAQLLN
jgi:tripartite-type tricarboxylate transporter receptor subunit TctC